MTQLVFGRDVQGYNAFAPKFVLSKFNVTLASGAPQSLTVPSSNANWIALFAFEPSTKVWVANNATAAAPSGSFAAATSELNPAARSVKAGDVLSFVTDNTTAEVWVGFYEVS
jgi:hypothetical protein